jgi:hypothetical protein
MKKRKKRTHSHRAATRDKMFFDTIAAGATVRDACAASGYASTSVYRWKENDDDFARAWADALRLALDLLEGAADIRGRDGYLEPVFFQGKNVGAKRKYSDALLLARLKALNPAAYRERFDVRGHGARTVTVYVRDFPIEQARETAVTVSDTAQEPPALPSPAKQEQR